MLYSFNNVSDVSEFRLLFSLAIVRVQALLNEFVIGCRQTTPTQLDQELIRFNKIQRLKWSIYYIFKGR